MRPGLLSVVTLSLVALGAAAASLTGPGPAPVPALASATASPDGISLPALSRCAGRAGTEFRDADPAFGILILDGAPGAIIQRSDEAGLLISTGALRRRDGTWVSFRFACALEARGQAALFRITHYMSGAGTDAPPARSVTGQAALPLQGHLPRGAELRVQLIDTSGGGGREVLSEQVVRSGWEQPIPFALYLPQDVRLDGRRLALDARVAVARQALFRLAGPQAVTREALGRPIMLMLEAVEKR